MKKVIFLIPLFVLSNPVFTNAQSTPLFEMPIYFEDVVGNKDSLIVGYDLNVDPEHLNPQYGEALIDSPFDSVFEVRAFHMDDSDNNFPSKKIISLREASSSGNCSAIDGIKIFFSLKYPPVRITWNKDLFMSVPCHQHFMLSPDWEIYIIQYPWDALVYYCMWGQDSIVDSLRCPDPFYEGYWLKSPFEVEGQGIKNLPGMFMVQYAFSTCQDVSADNQPKQQSVMLFPNPAGNALNLRTETPAKPGTVLLLYNAVGQVADQWPLPPGSQDYTFSLNALPEGMYFYVLKEGSSVLAAGKQVIGR